jgi:SAM-dependent methyltransferase
MQDDPSLKSAYALKTLDDTKALYRAWAEDYDQSFGAAQGYLLPQVVARAFVTVGGHGPVLDVGAGTGLVAHHLSQQKIGPVDGLDVSDEMLEVARAKGLYRDLINEDVMQGMSLPNGRYAGVLSAGTFTFGHVGAEGIDPLLTALRPSGIGVISINAEHYVAAGFEARFESLSDKIQSLTLQEERIYDDRADADHRADKAMIVTFKRA